MDDPTRRAPTEPSGDPQQAVQVHTLPMGPAPQPMQPTPMQPMMQPMVVQSLPGMPPLQHVAMPGVSVHISNVVGTAPGYGAPQYGQAYPQAYAPHAQPQHAYPPVPGGAPMVPHASQAQGVVSVMREDAAQRTMAAVQRRGPARVLGYTVGFGMLALMAGLLILLPLGVPFFAVLLAELPCALIAAIAFVMGGRAGEGISGHHLEQAILRVASEHEGVVKVVTLAQSTGRPLRECQLAIDAMVASGHATVDSDERGALFYRIPDLEPPARRGELA